MSAPSVSVVTIFLDAQPFLDEAVQSVLGQAYRDWELLLVDDGSTDGSSSIARRYAGSMPDRIRYIEHPGHENRGMAASRNLGVRHSSGRYVALLDADDVWLPDKLARQVSVLEREPEAAMVYGPAEWWYSWTGAPADIDRDFVHRLGVEPDTIIEPPGLLARFLADEGISPCTCSMLIRRDAFDAVGGFEESFRGLYEDQAFCAKVCLDMRVVAEGTCSYRYRQHADSALYVAAREGTLPAARARFLDWLASYLASRNVTNPELLRTLELERRKAQRRIGRVRRGIAGVGDLLRSTASRFIGGGSRDS